MTLADRVLRWSPLQLASGAVSRGRPSVLAYHGVDDPEGFAGSMDYLKRHYRPITIEDLDRAVNEGREIPDRSVLVTFDDGHLSVLEHGLPILSERGIPAVAFVVAGVLSTDLPFWWSSVAELVEHGAVVTGHEGLDGAALIQHLKQVPDQERRDAIAQLEASAPAPTRPGRQLAREDLGRLRSAGIDIGNHTWSHPCLNRCDPDRIDDEILSAHHSLGEALGQPPRWFAYPNGDWDPTAEEILSELGYRLGFLFDHRKMRQVSHPLRVSRLRVNSDTDPDRFAIILSGMHPTIHRARGRS
jgi:peptidoglycan/xylan/chitin deacetylase (PgdA/CDA1 family)